MKYACGLSAIMVMFIWKTVSCNDVDKFRIHDISTKNTTNPERKTSDSHHDALSKNKYYRDKMSRLLPALQHIQHNRARRSVSTLVRLQGGSSPEEGRLEVSVNGQWGTVCGDDFDVMDAVVACRMLGFTGEIPEVKPSSLYGQGAGPILLDQVKCYGTETSIFDCLHNDIGIHDCLHTEDVGINCFPSWKSNNIRLRNGAYPWEGGVEVFNGEWGSVCDDDFDIRDGQVVCRSLGYPNYNPSIFGHSYYGRDMADFKLDNLRCGGSETSVLSCHSRGWGHENCDDDEYAGVNCRPDIPTVPVKLVGGAQIWEGRLEVLNSNNHLWGTVCDDEFDENDATVVCKMLGFSRFPPTVESSIVYGQGTGDILLDDVRCSGTELSIFNCPNKGLGVHNCGHSEDVGINCQPSAPQTVVRLAYGMNAWEGRVRVWNEGTWNTVCISYFYIQDATVVCSMLGFLRGPPSLNYPYGTVTDPIWPFDPDCRGTEDNIFRCPRTRQTCDYYYRDVEINCQPSASPSVARLVNGVYPWEGRVEVWNSVVWGTVCQDFFDIYDARVVCSWLGYTGDTPTVKLNAAFGPGSGPILLADLGCEGTEWTLFHCSHNGTQALRCSHSRDVGVNCLPLAPFPAIRLVNSSRPWMGRVEVWVNKVWGTVCYDNFDTNDARVVCRMLGVMGDQPVVYDSIHFGQGSGAILMDNVSCNGSEQTIFQCAHNGLGEHSCGRSGDVGINCQPNAPLLPVRLVNGMQPWEGRLEVWNAGSWGTVCTDSFDVMDARVVCISLGYTSFHPGVFNSSHFGPGRGNIWLDDLQCLGTEQNIFFCPHSGLGITNCRHSQDAGVSCQTLAPHPIVRLSNGSFPWEGRIEVWNDGSWGTVCSYNFDANDARVVCRMLGFNGTSEEPTVSFYRQTTAIVWLDNVACQGSEDNILLCQGRALENHNCSNSQVAGTNCYPAAMASGQSDTTNQSMYIGIGIGAAIIVIIVVAIIVFRKRLTTLGCVNEGNSGNRSESRLEVITRRSRDTMCDDNFDVNDVGVICRIAKPTVLKGRAFGEGTGNIRKDEVGCLSFPDAMESRHNGPKVNNCQYNEDVDITYQTVTTLGCVNEGNSGNRPEGRLEVITRRSRGTLCDDNFVANDAHVIYRIDYSGACK